MALVSSKRDRLKFSREGYLYWFDKLVSNRQKKSWRCATTLENGKRCKGRVYTDLNDQFLELKHQHESRLGDAAQVEADAAITMMKQRAQTTQELPNQVRTAALQGLSFAGKARLPNNNALKMIIHRTRKANNVAPAQPIDRASIEIPENYSTYEYEPKAFENYLLADSGVGDENRILIFGRESAETWIEQVEKFFVDGTFSLAPALFSQIFVVMAARGGFVIPVIFALLPNKREQTYSRMIRMIRGVWSNFCPTAISLDFEQAVINAFSNAFPDAELQGCLFHLVKNMKRKLGEKGLIQRYNSDATFSLHARMIPALAFVPIGSLEDALEALRENLPEELESILDYFEDNYLGRWQKNLEIVAVLCFHRKSGHVTNAL